MYLILIIIINCLHLTVCMISSSSCNSNCQWPPPFSTVISPFGNRSVGCLRYEKWLPLTTDSGNCSTIEVNCNSGSEMINGLSPTSNEVILINSISIKLYCGPSRHYRIPLNSHNYDDSYFEIKTIYGITPYYTNHYPFNGSYRNSYAFVDCDSFPHIIHLDHSPAYMIYHDCRSDTVWSNSKGDCVQMSQSGCPRTSLACRRDCSPPSTKEIPTTSIANNRIKIPTIYPIVKWNECESRYVACPDGYSIVTYYSFTDIVYIHHNRTNATVYCGKHDNNYYVLYKNTRLNKDCSNTFEIVNCIASDYKSYDQEEYCIDDLIERKIYQIKLTAIENTKRIYLIAVVLTTLIIILTAIIQTNIRRLNRLVHRCMPETKVDRFVREHELWNIPSHRIRIDYDRCICKGNWSNVYFGSDKHIFNKHSFSIGNVSLKTNQLNDENSNIAVKIAKKKIDKMLWINEIFIRLTLDDQQHENIIRFYGFQYSNGLFRILLDVADCSLVDTLKTTSFSEERRAFVDLFKKLPLDIINGIIYLHGNEILHRNLCACNILLNNHGKAMISGFGRSIFFVNNSCTNYSNVDDYLLPIASMPPESIIDHRYSEKSDVWSFAILLYEVLTLGRAPYEIVGDGKKDAIVAYLKSGKRLSKPEFTDETIYKTMMQCWSLLPYYRPSFTELHCFFCQFSSQTLHSNDDIEHQPSSSFSNQESQQCE